jgi:hypothetical protein
MIVAQVTFWGARLLLHWANAACTPGTYTFALVVSVNGGSMSFSAGQDPMLLAPIVQRWSGEACQSNAMQAQISPANPQAYYICPTS